MYSIDIPIFLFVLFWSVIGLSKGFISELTSLILWAFGIYFAANYFYIPSGYIAHFIPSTDISNILSFISIFIIVFFLSNIFGYFLSHIIKILGYSASDKFLGLVFGSLKGIIFIVIIQYFLGFTNISSSHYWQESLFIGYIDQIIDKFLYSDHSLFDSFGLKI